MGKTSLLQRYEQPFSVIKYDTGPAIAISNGFLFRYVIKEFSDSYKTTIGADFLSMDVAVTDAQTVSLQVRHKAGRSLLNEFPLKTNF